MSRKSTEEEYLSSVFINRPFDKDYIDFFEATAFTIHDCGFIARCAKEVRDSGQTRISQILGIIRECRYGIHDISRTELDEINRLPRFNMPLELGLFLGAREFGGGSQGRKLCLILDKEQHRYQKFCSDIAGQDIASHDGLVEKLVSEVRNWLSDSVDELIPTGGMIYERYLVFKDDLPVISAPFHMRPEEMTFVDFRNFVVAWLEDNPPGSLVTAV